MSDRLLRRREVEQQTGLSRSSIYRKMDEGVFPRPRRLDGRASVRWPESSIRDWIDRQKPAERRV